MLADWRLTREAQIAPGFGNMMDAAMAGRIGNTVTINGTISNEVPVKAGERIGCGSSTRHWRDCLRCASMAIAPS